jgi:hypothetical protein
MSTAAARPVGEAAAVLHFHHGSAQQASPAFDIILRGGTIIDERGRAYRGDVRYAVASRWWASGALDGSHQIDVATCSWRGASSPPIRRCSRRRHVAGRDD